jgi:hypothetical protein
MPLYPFPSLSPSEEEKEKKKLETDSNWTRSLYMRFRGRSPRGAGMERSFMRIKRKEMSLEKKKGIFTYPSRRCAAAQSRLSEAVFEAEQHVHIGRSPKGDASPSPRMLSQTHSVDSEETMEGQSSPLVDCSHP